MLTFTAQQAVTLMAQQVVLLGSLIPRFVDDLVPMDSRNPQYGRHDGGYDDIARFANPCDHSSWLHISALLPFCTTSLGMFVLYHSVSALSPSGLSL